MPYQIIQISPLRYKVINSDTGRVHSKSTTLNKAKAQVRVLESIGEGKISSSEEAYLKVSEEAYRKPSERKGEVAGYIYDPELSDLRTAVYVSSGNIIISHRGTVPSDTNDLKEDALIVTGHFDKSDRVKKGVELVSRIIMKYPGIKISNTGHSLGGRIAQSLGLLLPVMDSKVVAFNPGSSPLDIAKNVAEAAYCKLSNNDRCKKLKNQTVYATGVDPISISSLLHSGRTSIIKPEGVNVHSLQNFKV